MKGVRSFLLLSSKAYWMALKGRSLWWLALFVGINTQGILIVWMMNRFEKVAYR